MNIINPAALEGRTAALGFATAAQLLFSIYISEVHLKLGHDE